MTDYGDLFNQAQSQVDSEIAAINNPLSSQIGTLTGDRGAAGTAIGKEFAGLLPFAQESAQRVGGSYASGLAMEQSIFQAAGQRMNQLKQDRAAEAQKLAQQMGGPVATGEFMQGLAPYDSQMPASEASNMLHGLGLAQAGVQEANQFAGQVLPALQTEEQAKSDQFFNDQIKSLQDQINSNLSSRSTLVNSRLNDLQQQQRSYDLNRAQLKLEQLKAQRDWQATKQEMGLRQASVTGKYKGKPTLEAQRLTAQQQNEAARIGISNRDYQLALQKAAVSESQRQEHINITLQKNAMEVLDAATGGTKPISLTVTKWIPKNSIENSKAILGKVSGAHYDTKRKQWYYYQHETLTPEQWRSQGYATGSISDPQRLYDIVRGAIPQLSKAQVIKMVRSKTGMNDWSPGQEVHYTGPQLHNMSTKEIDGIAVERGYKGKLSNRQAVIDFIMGHS